MHIIVPIATRDRPLRLAGALHSLSTLESGKHVVDYIVRIDEDDRRTLAVAPELEATYRCSLLIKPRPQSLGQSWNELVQDREWDVCVVIADKHLCLTPEWDDIIAEGFGPKHRLALARWTLLRAPEETLLIMSRKWYDVTQQVFPEWFPFWFSERWVFEVHKLAFNVGIPMVKDLVMQEPPVRTQNLRDLEFWFDFFAKTRPLRVWESQAIAKAWGARQGNIRPLLEEMQKADEWQKPRIPMYYEHRGSATGEPSQEYLMAKQKAETWLAANAIMETQGAA